MKFKLEITCDNAAFGDGMAQTIQELARLLDDARTRLVVHATEQGKLRDHNGNTVGKYWFEGERE